MSASAPRYAYGVDPHRPERYSLRQARYDALAEDIDAWAGIAARQQRRLSVIDIGCSSGLLYRHLEPRANFPAIDFHATDVAPALVYRVERYASYRIEDLMQGCPGAPSNAYDVVVCEQVLEHLPKLDLAIATLARIAKPGGRVCIGVPIFAPPAPALRNLWIAASLKMRPDKSWTHIQTFSQWSFLRRIREHSNLQLREVRGFRIISGGVLRGLENYRWWWRLNRRIGRLIPWACIEVQAIFDKPPA